MWKKSHISCVPNRPHLSPFVPIGTLPPKLRVENPKKYGGEIRALRVADTNRGVKIMPRDGIRAVAFYVTL